MKIATPPASLAIEPEQDQRKNGMMSIPNQSAKSDRLELPAISVETVTTPAAQESPMEAPSTETITIPSRHWQDAKAKIPPSQPPHLRKILREPKKSVDSTPPKVRAEVWHCRQDAMGDLLRSLDLSPRCKL